MKYRRLLLFVTVMVMGFTFAQAEGWIRINQLGYLPQATKVAVLMSEEDVDITNFELVDAYTGQTAYHSTATRYGTMGTDEGNLAPGFQQLQGRRLLQDCGRRH